MFIYYGLKFPVREAEIAKLQRETHSYQRKARKFGLDCYWGDFSPFDYEYCVLIGKELGVIGAEHDWNQEIAGTKLPRILANTEAALRDAGFQDEPKLFMHLQPDSLTPAALATSSPQAPPYA